MSRAEPFELQTSIAALTQQWANAVAANTDASVERQRTLSDYNMHMNLLEECARVIKYTKEDYLTNGLQQAVAQCTQLGTLLAVRHAAKKKIRYALAPWNQLKETYNDFRISVDVVHSLVQE